MQMCKPLPVLQGFPVAEPTQLTLLILVPQCPGCCIEPDSGSERPDKLWIDWGAGCRAVTSLLKSVGLQAKV